MEKNSIEYIGWLLSTNDRAVEKAIVVLYNRQTVDEQMAKDTRHKNGRGFSAGDARKGSYMAKYVLDGNHLSGKWLMDARAMAFKYIGQLVEEATMKAERAALAAMRDRAIEKEYRQTETEVVSRIDREAAEELSILESEAQENEHESGY